MSFGLPMEGMVIDDGLGAGMMHQRAAASDEIGSEIVEDLVEAMTFQKLTCTPRMDSPSSSGMSTLPLVESPTVRARRARTVTAQTRPGALPGEVTRMLEDKPGSVRPRKVSQGSTTLETRRKRSYSMCESDEDDELASLSSTASYQSASKHQKLRDDTDDDELAPTCAPLDAIHWTTSLSSTSITSSDSSASLLHPPATIPSRLGQGQKPSVFFASSLTSSSATATPSTSSRSSPRSSVSSPRSTVPASMPSVFKRAQSDCTVLHLRNNSVHFPSSLACPSPSSKACKSPATEGADYQMEVTPVDAVTLPSETSEELRNAPKLSSASTGGSAALSGSGRRSVSASSLPTTYRILQVAPIAPQITFSSSISAFAPIVVKPVPLTSPPSVRRPRAQDPRSPPPFSVDSPHPTIQRSDSDSYS